MPILKKYNMKAVSFLIGEHTYNNKKGKINYNTMQELKNYILISIFRVIHNNLHK